jgi:hypothetical protein
MGGLKRHPLHGVDRATATRLMRFPSGVTSMTLGEAAAGRYPLFATCLACWHERRFDAETLAAVKGTNTQLDDVAKRLRCRCGARNSVLGVRQAPPP